MPMSMINNILNNESINEMWMILLINGNVMYYY